MAVAVVLALGACREVEQGVLQPIAPLAGLRYVNLVNDTSAVDFRIINFIGDAPSAGAAPFRTGGAPFGVSTNFLPPHWPVEAGREVHVRVFMNGTTPAIASQVVFDTTCTFTEGTNYTFYLYGNARGAGVHALVTTDAVPAITGNNIAVRAIHLGSTLAPSLATANVDVDVVAQSSTSPLTGTARFSNLAYLAVSNYVTLPVGATLMGVASAPGTRTFTTFKANLPAGTVGTTTVNPIAGSNVPGTGISVVVVPASVTGSAAPQTTAYLSPTILFLIDLQPPLTAP